MHPDSPQQRPQPGPRSGPPSDGGSGVVQSGQYGRYAPQFGPPGAGPVPGGAAPGGPPPPTGPGPHTAQLPGGPRRGPSRNVLIGGAAAIAVLIVLAIGLTVALTGSGQQGPAGGPLGPVAGPGEEPGRRAVTEVAPSSGRTLTVAQDGSGEFTSIQEAAAQTRPGDTVVISAGVYDEQLDIPTSGAPDAYITYHAAPGAEVVISGSTDTDGLIEIRDRSWIRLIGLTVTESSDHGIYGSEADNIVVQDVAVADTADGGIVFINGSNIQIVHSEVRNSNARGLEAKNEAVSLSNVDGFEVAYSIVEDCGEEGIDAKYEARNGSIHGNITRNNRGPNIYVDAANTIQVYNNTVVGASGENKAGIFLGVEDISETRRTYDVAIFNNVITGNAGGGITFFVESEGTFSGVSIVNNTIVGNRGDGINPRDYSFEGTNLLRNNLVTGNDRDSAGDMGVFAADHNLFGSGPIGSEPVEGEVAFVDAGNGDLRLAEGSAGIGAGIADGAPAVDILGGSREGAAVDLGAYRYSGGSS